MSQDDLKNSAQWQNTTKSREKMSQTMSENDENNFTIYAYAYPCIYLNIPSRSLRWMPLCVYLGSFPPQFQISRNCSVQWGNMISKSYPHMQSGTFILKLCSRAEYWDKCSYMYIWVINPLLFQITCSCSVLWAKMISKFCPRTAYYY